MSDQVATLFLASAALVAVLGQRAAYRYCAVFPRSVATPGGCLVRRLQNCRRVTRIARPCGAVKSPPTSRPHPARAAARPRPAPLSLRALRVAVRDGQHPERPELALQFALRERLGQRVADIAAPMLAGDRHLAAQRFQRLGGVGRGVGAVAAEWRLVGYHSAPSHVHSPSAPLAGIGVASGRTLASSHANRPACSRQRRAPGRSGYAATAGIRAGCAAIHRAPAHNRPARTLRRSRPVA
jgi:hypothetical protein